MRESAYQAKLIRRLYREFPGCIVVKLDPSHQQGILDLLILWFDQWASLEVKAYANAPMRPNQQYYVDLLNEMSFGAVIHPSNEEEVLSDLQQAFRSHGSARISRS